MVQHALRKTLCEHVTGLCPAGWLNEQSITKHWFQTLRTCPYSWATGRNNSSGLPKCCLLTLRSTNNNDHRLLTIGITADEGSPSQRR